MDKGKLKIFRGLYRTESTAEQKALEAQSAKILREAELVRGLMKHPGWELLDEFFERKQVVMGQELKLVDPTNVKQVTRLQEKSKIIDEFKAFLNSKLIRDPDL